MSESTDKYLPNPASDKDLDDFILAANGRYEFSIGVRISSPNVFDMFRQSLDNLIEDYEDREATVFELLFKEIAPVGTIEKHIDTRLLENENE